MPTVAAGNLPSDLDLTKYQSDVENILDGVFGQIRNPDLPNVLVYFPKNGQAKTPLLTQGDEIVRVLDREAAVWAVVVAEVDVGTACPAIGMRLTGTGHTRPTASLSLSELLAVVAMRKDREGTAVDAKEEELKTKPLAPGFCYGVQRFTLPQDMTLHLTARYQRTGDVVEQSDPFGFYATPSELAKCAMGIASCEATPAPVGEGHSTPSKAIPGSPPCDYEAEKITFVSKNSKCSATDLLCHGGNAGSAICEAKTIECKNRSDNSSPMKCEWKTPSCRVSGPPMWVSCQRAEITCSASEEIKTALFFANGRRPLYSASLGFGTNIHVFGHKGEKATNCWDEGGCRPNLYLFGHLLQGHYRLHARDHFAASWEPAPSISGAVVLGVRILDPVLGDAIAGVRLGIDDGRGELPGVLRGLARFGLVVGVSYSFRTFDKKTATVSTSTTTNGTTVTTTESNTTDVAAGNRFGILAGIDFAF